MKDPTLTVEERTAIAHEYTAKYLKVEALALSRVSIFQKDD